MRRATTTVLAVTVLAAGCGDTDVANRGEEVAPGQEVEDLGVELDVEPVDLEAQPWFRESGTIEFGGRTWMLAGEPVYDPAVERVGEYQGTPLYAEANVAPPYRELFIPLENDAWQMLLPATDPGEAGPVQAPMTEIPGEVPGGGAEGGGA